VAIREMVRPWMPSLIAAWLVGVALLSVWHLGGWIQVRRMARRATRPVDEGWELALIRLRRRLGIEHAVTILESAAAPDDLSLDKLVELRIFNVTPGYIREMAGLGYRDLSADKLVAFRIHGVTREFIREIA
jgi:hypothetical protein